MKESEEDGVKEKERMDGMSEGRKRRRQRRRKRGRKEERNEGEGERGRLLLTCKS